MFCAVYTRIENYSINCTKIVLSAQIFFYQKMFNKLLKIMLRYKYPFLFFIL